MDKKTLGLFIKERRQELNLSQLDVANMLDITTQAISRWENGLSYPNFVLLGDLAKILKISINDLLSLNCSNESKIQEKVFNQSTFGPNINRYLKSLKLTQLDLENKIKLSQASISNIINGKAFPTIPQFIQLCKLFNVSYEDLYYSQFQKTIKNTKNIKVPVVISFVFCIIIILLSMNLVRNNTTNNINGYYPIIEFYDNNNNLLSSKKYEQNSIITPPSYNPILGFNKEIQEASFSTIYKENKNPFALTLNVTFEDNFTKKYHFETYDEFNIYKIQNNNEYCYKLTHTNNEEFNINNINKNYYEVKAYTKPNKTHTISFPSLDLAPLSIKTGETINDLPYIFNENFIIIDYIYNDKIIKNNNIYSFEKSISLYPNILNQTTMVNNEGYITYLSSEEEEIIIPSQINNISIKGIASNSIHLNNHNSKIIFLNEDPIKFNNVFYNTSLIKNIKEIIFKNMNIRKYSCLGDIVYLNKITVYYTYNRSLDKYLLKTISSNPNFKISKLEYYSDSFSCCSFQGLNVDEAYCLDEEFAYIYNKMFSNCSLKRIIFKASILTSKNEFIIEDLAFSNCVNLESFNFPNNTYLSGTSQFYNCSNLNNINFYGNINSFTNYMFYNTPLNKITCNYAVDIIYNNAFINTNIKEIEITALNKIEDYIYFPPSLKNLYIGSKHKNPFIIREHNDLTIHYLDHSIYEKINAPYSTCVNCLHLHYQKEK